MIKHKRPKHLHVYQDRYGRQRIYFRRPGQPRLASPGPLYREEFWTAYHTVKEGALKPVEIGASHTVPGTMSDLIVKYYHAPKYISLGESTKKPCGDSLTPFGKNMGTFHFGTLNANTRKRSWAECPTAWGQQAAS